MGVINQLIARGAHLVLKGHCRMNGHFNGMLPGLGISWDFFGIAAVMSSCQTNGYVWSFSRGFSGRMLFEWGCTVDTRVDMI